MGGGKSKPARANQVFEEESHIIDKVEGFYKKNENKERVKACVNKAFAPPGKISKNPHAHCVFVQHLAYSLYHDVVHRLYNTVSQSQCNDQTCPRMQANSNYPFLWSVPGEKETSCGATTFVDNLAGWVEQNEANRKTFMGTPEKADTKDYKAYLAAYDTLIKHCIRLVTHISFAHYKTITEEEMALLCAACYRIAVLRRLYEGSVDAPGLIDPSSIMFIHGLLDEVEKPFK